MDTLRTRTRLVLALQLAALAALVWSLLGHAWLDPRSRPRLLVLVDRSLSVPRAQADAALADLARGTADLQRLEFAGRPAAAPGGEVDASATNIESALQAALAAHAEAAFDGLVVVSDGHANAGDTTRGLRAVHDAGLPLRWLAVGRAPPAAYVTQVLAPARVLAGQRIQVVVRAAAPPAAALRVDAQARGAAGERQSASGDVDADGRATIEFDAGGSGPLMIEVTLLDRVSGTRLDTASDAAVVDVVAHAPVLYVQGSSGPLARSLARGGWALDVVPAARLDASTDQLEAYRAVILDDVAVSDAGARFWSALARAVTQRGVGLLVLGGERSFARGGYRDSVLESLLPVRSEPAALDEPASVVFAVDKSGSMGQGSGGVDRFALAQRAVLETARTLGGRDALGLLVFDVEPRVLIPLGPATAGMQALARAWLATPNGGTRLAPALDAAIGELERAGASRRLLVVVTDGFVDETPPAGLQARLERSRIDSLWLAIGPDADVKALQRVVGPDTGLVLHVDQAAELPLVMRSGLERRRARVERGLIAVEQPRALPFAPGRLADWPAVAAHAVTRARPEALVAVQSRRGEPLLAFRSAGRGRVAAVTSGLGDWTPLWLRWPEWPRLAGGLADWVSAGAGPTLPQVTDLPQALQVELDDPKANDRAPSSVSMVVTTPAMNELVPAAEQVAPGRLRATVPAAGPGLYRFVVTTPTGSTRHLHLRRQRAETDVWGTSPELAAWRSAGLVGEGEAWSSAAPHDARARRPPDRSLVALALVLFLTAIVLDRSALAGAALRRWR